LTTRRRLPPQRCHGRELAAAIERGAASIEYDRFEYENVMAAICSLPVYQS